MCDALARVYAKPKLFLERGTKEVDAALNYHQMKDIALGYTRYGTGMILAYPESDFTLQTFPICGKGGATIDRFALPVGPCRGIALSPGMRVTIKLNISYEHFFLVINTQALANKVAAITGISVHSPLKLEPIRDDARPAAKALREHSLFLINKMSTSVAPIPDVILAEFEQTLMVMFLYANRHNYSNLLEWAFPDVGPWQIRRAEEYIEANWQKPISLEDLAEVTGISALGLFRSFRKTRGYSPMEFANQVRLSRARELLRRPDATTTVATVASTCGFADLDRFEGDYRRAFSELPSTTLSRGHGIDPVWH